MKLINAWRRRGLPTNPRALKFCQSSYAQFGEDLLADTIFGKSYGTGHYVDVGCFDPQKWSNTYRFYQMGWTGIAIDPNDAYAELWERYRPKDQFVRKAVSDQPGTSSYLKYPGMPQGNRLQQSTLPSAGEHESEVVPCDSLSGILDKYWMQGRVIDLMSIDCEGHDLAVLESGDFDRFRPRVLIVEDHDHLKRSPIDEFCLALDYKLLAFSAKSKLYGDRRWMSTRNAGSVKER